MTKITPEIDKKIVELYVKGISSLKIAKIYDCSDQTVRRHLKKNKVKIRSHTKVTSEMRKKIVELYESGYGTWKIAKIFNLGINTIRYNLLKSGIKLRQKPEINNKMVTEFIKDYRKGLYAAQIAKKFNLSDSTVRRHLKKRNIKMKPRGKRQEILPTAQIITPEKAYIMGVVGHGDGFIEYNKNSKRICLETIDKDFANFFAFCLKKTYGLKPKIKVLKPRPTDTTTHYKVTLCSVAACEDLLRYEVSYKEENWRVPKEIKEASEEIKCMYLRGIADSQGSVCHSGSVRWIELSSKNTTGLKEIGDLLKELNIVDWYIHKNGLRITARRSLLLFAQKVGFTIERKRITLTNLLNSYKVWKTPEKETIKLMPEILRLKRSRSNSLEIAKKLGVHPSTIYNYLRKLNKKDSPEQIEWIGIKR